MKSGGGVFYLLSMYPVLIYRKEHTDESAIQVLPPVLLVICSMKYAFFTSFRPSRTPHFSFNSIVKPFSKLLCFVKPWSWTKPNMSNNPSDSINMAHAGGVNGVGKEKDDVNTALLERYQTASSVIIPREVFETMYLSPYTRTRGHLRSIFGSPTPM